MNKLLDTATPGVEFTRRKYAEAHDAIVASAAYTHALEAAAHILHRVRILRNCTKLDEQGRVAARLHCCFLLLASSLLLRWMQRTEPPCVVAPLRAAQAAHGCLRRAFKRCLTSTMH